MKITNNKLSDDEKRWFEDIYCGAYNVLYRYAFSLVTCEADSKDLVQTTFLTLLENRNLMN